LDRPKFTDPLLSPGKMLLDSYNLPFIDFQGNPINAGIDLEINLTDDNVPTNDDQPIDSGIFGDSDFQSNVYGKPNFPKQNDQSGKYDRPDPHESSISPKHPGLSGEPSQQDQFIGQNQQKLQNEYSDDGFGQQPDYQPSTFGINQFDDSYNEQSLNDINQSDRDVPKTQRPQLDPNLTGTRSPSQNATSMPMGGPMGAGNMMMGGMMMMMTTLKGTPLTGGGSCSAGTFCLARDECNPYDGFIIMNENQLNNVRPDSPKVPLLSCFVLGGGISDGVCCQLPHPLVGPNGQILD